MVNAMTSPRLITSTDVSIPPYDLAATLNLPNSPLGLVAFAHGSGSSRHSPRNMAVATALNKRGLGTLLFDLLSSEDEADRGNVFDIFPTRRALGRCCALDFRPGAIDQQSSSRPVRCQHRRGGCTRHAFKTGSTRWCRVEVAPISQATHSYWSEPRRSSLLVAQTLA
jgi:hypothetical protein